MDQVGEQEVGAKATEPIPTPDYHAAKAGAALAIRDDRRFLHVLGRAPGDMLDGLLTNSLPPAPVPDGSMLRGRASYSALLSHKGKMISDLRVFSVEGGFLLDLPLRGFPGTMEHFKKFLPPRMAWVQNRSREYGLLTLVGPEIPSLLSETSSSLGIRASLEGIEALKEGDELIWELDNGEEVRLLRNGDLNAEAWDVLAPSVTVRELRAELEEGGVVALSEAARNVLRLERGRPAFGVDMDEGTIPLEAGIEDRAIDFGKGCYAGQEVVIRIRDRGHVNRLLRGFLMEGLEIPEPGSAIFHPDREKSVGTITSSVWSPSHRVVIGLGYLRRGMDEGDVVSVGGPGGQEARVKDLGPEDWVTG